ncbi:MAG: hypothetical protein RL723_1230 [Actinomycetota bacterium]
MFGKTLLVGVALILLSSCSNSSQKAEVSKFLDPTNEDPYSASVFQVHVKSEKCGIQDHGSGFAATSKYIVTNAHVVAGASEIKVSSDFAPNEVDGKLVYFDPKRDISIIEVRTSRLKSLQIGSDLTQGEVVNAYGYTGGRILRVEESVSIRTVKWKAKDIFDEGEFDLEVNELKAHISTGDSGGALIDKNGLVRGIVFAKSSSVGERAYAMPASYVNEALKAVGTQVVISNTKCLPR